MLVGLTPAGETWQDGEIGGKGGVGKNRDTPGRDGPTGCRCDLRAGSMERRRNPGATRRGRQGSPVTSCRSEEHTSELQSLMRSSYAVFCLKKKKTIKNISN